MPDNNIQLPRQKKIHSVTLAFTLIFVLICGFFIRLYDLKDPPLDFHATRQLRSAIIARSFYFQFKHDAPADLTRKSAELASLETYEPPIMEFIVGIVNSLVGEERFWTGRIFSAFFWTLGGFFLILIGFKAIRHRSALFFSLLFYCFAPACVIASRAFQPDPWMCAWTVIAAFFIYRWMERPSWGRLMIAAIVGGLCILIKVFAGFFIGLMLISGSLAIINRENWRKILLQTTCAGILALLPSVMVYSFLNAPRSGDFFSFWVVSLSRLLLTTKFYASWIAMIKGQTGLILFTLALCGVSLHERKMRGLLIGWWAGYFLYGMVVPYQIMTHEYYSLILFPLMALSLLPIWQAIIVQCQRRGKSASFSVAIIATLLAAYQAYAACGTLRANDYSLESVSWQRVSAAIPQDCAFTALTADYGMRLNYFGWRTPKTLWSDSADARLFSLAGREKEDFSSSFSAATADSDLFLVTALGELENQTELKEKLRSLPVFYEGNGFIIFDLRE